jgi:hypothetical protein
MVDCGFYDNCHGQFVKDGGAMTHLMGFFDFLPLIKLNTIVPQLWRHGWWPHSQIWLTPAEHLYVAICS